MRVKILGVATLAFLMMVSLVQVERIVSAHGLGASFEEMRDGYFVDIGYDPSEIRAGDQVLLDFNLYEDETATTRVEYSDVWVNISPAGENRALFAGGLMRSNFGITRMSIVLPDEGDYVMSARFQRDGQVLVESEFTLNVGGVPQEDGGRSVEWLLGAAALAAAIAFIGAAYCRRGVANID